MKKIVNVIYVFLFLFLLVGGTTVASEEVAFDLVEKNQIYEIRYYEPMLVAEVEYTGDNGGFGALFNYISGANIYSSKKNSSSSIKIEMTAPVTRLKQNNKNVMQFFLPKRFTAETVPVPVNPNVKIKSIDGGYFAAITYSGSASENNFLKHVKILSQRLLSDKIIFLNQLFVQPTMDPLLPLL